ncbi:hypothetical protein [Salimicrobium halophilum]|uniref:YesK-like protein n=1 Tax=Salimicrobium halophilum TaxID=86666 RepID=A0A1G8RCC4_9BACI|nr:hypothetical protein [Salimicrobium halophilum]SDJ14647.1 hypothetical protein SAMN04490247_0952 [Salimicrobium halophilum]
MDIILSIILVITLIISVSYVVFKRKQAGITGMKSALTPICLFLIGVVNLFAYWFGFSGLVSWTMSIVLLLLGAYFTKYIQAPVKQG